jgi:hypothetical protein
LQWISVINKQIQDNGQRYTLLPFKLHQFISQTGSVYTTLDQDENRFITLEPGVYRVDDGFKKPIYPSVFSRASGHAFICVSKQGNKLEPREFRVSSDDDQGATDGYLIIGEDLWDPLGDLELLPEAWVRQTKTGPTPDSKKKAFFPTRLYFNELGECSESKLLKWWGWFMKAPLLFDPTAGVFYDTKTNEGTKLTKLGSEGRSTSTTITAFSILNRLHDAGYRDQDQKLLSFTDNRQDAALQAGHFNDFVQVVRLRAGIRKALELAPGNTLNYATLGEAIFKALNAPFLEFAMRNLHLRTFVNSTSAPSRSICYIGRSPTCAAAGASCCPIWSSAPCLRSPTPTSTVLLRILPGTISRCSETSQRISGATLSPPSSTFSALSSPSIAKTT